MIIIAVGAISFVIFAVRAIIKWKDVVSYAPQNDFQTCRLFADKLQLLPQNKFVVFNQLDYIKLEELPSRSITYQCRFVLGLRGQEYIFAFDPRLHLDIPMRVGPLLEHFGFENSGSAREPEQTSLYEKNVVTYRYNLTS